MLMQAPRLQRIESCSKSIQNTIKWKSGRLYQAESMADLAGRLLRRAQSRQDRNVNKVKVEDKDSAKSIRRQLLQ